MEQKKAPSAGMKQEQPKRSPILIEISKKTKLLKFNIFDLESKNVTKEVYKPHVLMESVQFFCHIQPQLNLTNLNC